MFWFLIFIVWLVSCGLVVLFFYGASRYDRTSETEELYDLLTSDEREYGYDIWNNSVICEIDSPSVYDYKLYLGYVLKSIPMSVQRSFFFNGFKILVVPDLQGFKYNLDFQNKKLFILSSEMKRSCFSLHKAFAEYVFILKELDKDNRLIKCFEDEKNKLKECYFSEEKAQVVDSSVLSFFIELFVLYQVGYFKIFEDKQDNVKQSYAYISKIYERIKGAERIDSISLTI